MRQRQGRVHSKCHGMGQATLRAHFLLILALVPMYADADFGASKAFQSDTITDGMKSIKGSVFWMAPEVSLLACLRSLSCRRHQG